MSKETKETPEVIDFIFKVAMEVYEENENKKNAKIRINNRHGTNISSCDMYLNIIFCMLDGRTYTYGPNEMATERLLHNISSLLGVDSLARALTAVEGHLNKKNVSSKSEKWKIYEKWKLFNEKQLKTINSSNDILNDIKKN